MNALPEPLCPSTSELPLALLLADDLDELERAGTASATAAAPLLSKTRIGPSDVFGTTCTERLGYVSDSSQRACGVSWPETTSDLFLFTQEDPIYSHSNWYAYSDSDPIMLSDPLGLQALPKPQPAPVPVPRPGPVPVPQYCPVPAPPPIPAPIRPPWWVRNLWLLAFWNNTADAPAPVPVGGGKLLPFPTPAPTCTPCPPSPTPTPTPTPQPCWFQNQWMDGRIRVCVYSCNNGTGYPTTRLIYNTDGSECKGYLAF